MIILYKPVKLLLINSRSNHEQNEIEQAINQINTTQTALSGENKLHTDQESTNRQIEGLSSLNTAQINAEKDLVNQAKTRTDVAQKLAAAKEINSAMSNLRDGIQNKEDIKRSSAYINADPTKVTAYDQALQNAENIINATPNVEFNKVATLNKRYHAFNKHNKILMVFNN